MQSELQLQDRLHQLEKRVQRQKWTNVALFVGAIIAVSATRVVSQNNIKEMTLNTLKIVGSDGKVRAVLSGETNLNKDGGSLFLFDNKGNPSIAALSEAKGGTISILDEKGNPRAVLGYDGDGGLVSLAASSSGSKVDLAASKDLAGVVTSGPNGKQNAVIGGDTTGGMVELYDTSGKLKKRMP